MAGNDMKYIDLLNNFWKLNTEHSFTPNEKAVYFALLYKWNDLHRNGPLFNYGNDQLCSASGMSINAMKRAREVLKVQGLIDFNSGDGRRLNTNYVINDTKKGVIYGHLLGTRKVSLKDTFSNKKVSIKVSSDDTLDEKKVSRGDDYISKDIEETYSIKEREEKEEIAFQKKSPVPLINTSLFSSMEDVEYVCLNESTQWQESMMRRFAITSQPEIKNWIKKFFEEMRAQGQDKRNLTDTTSHCFNWIRIQIEKEKSSAQKEKERSHTHQAKGVMAGMAWGGVQRRRKQ